MTGSYHGLMSKYDQSKQQFKHLSGLRWKYHLVSPLWLGILWLTTVGYVGYKLVSYDWQGQSMWLSVPQLTTLLIIYFFAAALALAACVALCLTYQTNYGDVFNSKHQSARIQGDVESILNQIGCCVSNECLRAVLPEIEKTISDAKAIGILVLPSGFTIQTDVKLEKSDFKTFDIVMRESLYEWLTYDSYEESHASACNVKVAWDEVPLTPLAQDYILTHFPELIVACPMRFSAENMERARHGLSHVIAALKVMSLTNKEIRLRAHEWYSTPQQAALGSAATELPVDVIWA